MTDKSNKPIASVPYKHFADAVKSIVYATGETQVEFSSIHFHVHGDELRMSCTDGFRHASSSLPIDHTPMDSFGVDASFLVSIIDEMESTAKLDDLILRVIDDTLAIETVNHQESTRSVPIVTNWKHYQWLHEPRKHLAEAEVDCKDLISACRRIKGNDTLLTFNRGIGAAVSSITAYVRGRDGDPWNEALWMPASETPDNCTDCEIVWIGVQKKFLMESLRRCGKRARLHMIHGWPARAGGIRIIGGDDSIHIIASIRL